MKVERRNIAIAVILSIVTCGIYFIYWFYKLADDLYKVNGLKSQAGLDVILSLITCGIYYIYMFYKMGYMLRDASGGRIADKSVLFVILALFGLSIIGHCIIQSELNNNFA